MVLYGNLPFDFCNDAYFRELMQTITPGWRPMDRSVISDRISREKKAKTKAVVDRVCVSMQSNAIMSSVYEEYIHVHSSSSDECHSEGPRVTIGHDDDHVL